MAESTAKNGGEKPPVDIDAILNRHRVNLARSQKIIERWHPKRQEEMARGDNESDNVTANFDDLLRPELAGLGADLTPKSNSGVHGHAGEGELGQLRKQLLGRKAASNSLGRKDAPQGASQQRNDSTASLKRNQPADEASDDDSEGRSASFKSKRAKTQKPSKSPKSDSQTDFDDRAKSQANARPSIESENPHITDTQPAAPKLEVRDDPPVSASDSDGDETTSKVKSTSILDQVIAERKKKKKKKKHKKKRPTDGSAGVSTA